MGKCEWFVSTKHSLRGPQLLTGAVPHRICLPTHCGKQATSLCSTDDRGSEKSRYLSQSHSTKSIRIPALQPLPPAPFSPALRAIGNRQKEVSSFSIPLRRGVVWPQRNSSSTEYNAPFLGKKGQSCSKGGDFSVNRVTRCGGRGWGPGLGCPWVCRTVWTLLGPCWAPKDDSELCPPVLLTKVQLHVPGFGAWGVPQIGSEGWSWCE